MHLCNLKLFEDATKSLFKNDYLKSNYYKVSLIDRNEVCRLLLQLIIKKNIYYFINEIYY